MSDYQSAMAHPASAPAAVAAKPRISADAFRSLTARLKKADVVVPAMVPVIEVASFVVPAMVPVIDVAPIVVPAMVPVVDVSPVAYDVPEETEIQAIDISVVALQEPTPVLPEPEIVEVAAPLEMSALLEPSPVLPEPEIIEVVSPPNMAVLPEFEALLPEFEALAPAPLALTPALPDTDLFVQPEASVEALFEPAADPAVVEPVLDIATLEAVFEQAPEPIEIEEPQAFPDLPPFVETPVMVLSPEPEEVLEGSFSENFTYVPENGKDAPEPKIDLADVSEAVKQEVAQRAAELELENIWRLLLAKPTAEDRNTYLREAAEYHAADEEWNRPAPEHDLSQIEPALPEQVEMPDDVIAAEPAVIERSLVDNLPAASGQDLAELSRSLLDMMASGNASGLPQERALAADTLLRIVPRLELKPVILLAQRLAMMDNPPHLLVTRLIRDPRVAVAGPLLEDCTHISDKDLESVVAEGEPDKLRMIARRRKLSRAISDAVIKSGDASAVLTLVRNAEADISHDGYQSLLVLSEQNAELLAPLATRQDLSAPFAFELFWLAPAQLRRFILSRFLTDSETLTKILKITLATNNEEEVEAEHLSQHTMLEALERAARGHTEVASEELSTVLQVSPNTIQRILGDLAGEPLVVMLKAAGYPRSAVPGLLKRMQDADLPIISREREIGDLQSMFETLSFNKARILLTYWDWAQSKSGPYAPVH